MKKPKKAWKPVPVAVQVKRHAKAVVAARKAAAKHPSKAVAAKRSAAGKKAAATRAKHRKWSPDEDVALCSARAVAESLRIALGRPVSDSAVLDLYWSVAVDADAGASIEDVLEAVQRRGLHDFRPRRWGHPAGVAPSDTGAVLILGVDWPQPHAVVAHDGFWWSWGERYEPWTDEVSEAWAVTWQ